MAAEGSPDWWLERLPTADSVLEDYVKTVHERDEPEVKALLRRLLVHSGTFGLLDKLHFDDMRRQQRAGTLPMAVVQREHSRQLILYAAGKAPTPWDGISWVLDCLPHRPTDALTTIEASFSFIRRICRMVPSFVYTTPRQLSGPIT